MRLRRVVRIDAVLRRPVLHGEPGRIPIPPARRIGALSRRAAGGDEGSTFPTMAVNLLGG